MAEVQHKFGFLVTNLFQAEQMVELCRAFGRNGSFVCKPDLESILRSRYGNVEIVSDFNKSLIWQNGLARHDGRFDVLVAHRSYSGFERFQRTRVALIQYGYAKSAYNYGPWRAVADLNLVYGPHAADAIKVLSPVREVGHPLQEFITKPRPPLAGSKLRVLYAPTWKNLSSIDRWADEISMLASSHILTLRPHHNTVLQEPDRMARLQAMGGHFACNETRLIDLICESDVVISDYSGAVFEAILASRPVVLVDVDPDIVYADRKVNSRSIEIAHRNEIGLVAEPGKLAQAVVAAVNGSGPNGIDRAMLFADVDDPLAEMVKALKELAEGQIIPNDTQRLAQRAERNRRKRRYHRRLTLAITVLTVILIILGLATTRI